MWEDQPLRTIRSGRYGDFDMVCRSTSSQGSSAVAPEEQQNRLASKGGLSSCAVSSISKSGSAEHSRRNSCSSTGRFSAPSALGNPRHSWGLGSANLLSAGAYLFAFASDRPGADRPMTPDTSRKVVRSATTFHDPNLLRGAPVHRVLSGFGSLFATSEGRSSHFEMSQPVPKLDYFISHNWSTGRWSKFFALSLRFNLAPAVIAGWAVGLAASLLTALELLDDHAPYRENGVPRTFNSWLLGQATFLLVLLSWQEIKRLLSRLHLLGCTSQVFLDKVCIHQTNKEIQGQGIAHLAGFLRASEKMIVVYSDLYLSRLWTVYEVASFLTLHEDSSRIVLTPTSWPLYFAAMMGSGSLNHVLYHLGVFMASSPDAAVPAALIGPFSVLLLTLVYCFVMRNWLRCVHDMAERIEQFSIRRADCKVESDRSLVQDNICHFMRHLGRTPMEAKSSQALDDFDQLVREKLQGCLRTSLGRNTFPYWFVVAVSMAYVLDAQDATASYILDGRPPVKVFAAFLGSAVNAFAPAHFGIALSKVALHRRMDLSGFREVLFVCCSIALFLGPVSLLYMPSLVLYSLTVNSPDGSEGPFALALVCYDLLFIALSAWLYRPIRTRPQSPDAAPDDAPDLTLSSPREEAIPEEMTVTPETPEANEPDPESLSRWARNIRSDMI